MESADLGVVLDSSVAIEAEREQLNVADFLRRIAVTIGEREASLSVITVAELAHGIYRADTPERRERRRLYLDELKAAVMVYPIYEIQPSWLAGSALSRLPRVLRFRSTIF